jgi:hypothetical protein
MEWVRRPIDRMTLPVKSHTGSRALYRRWQVIPMCLSRLHTIRFRGR